MLKNLIIPTKQNNYNPIFSSRVAIVFLTLWILLFNSFSSLLIGEFGVYATSMSADRIIQLANEERVQRGLPRVTSNALLTSAAHAKANDMFEKQYWDHFGPNGESPWDFIKAAGYNYVYAGENLGKGFTTSEGVHQAWMASPTHRDNILGANYRDIGIAIVSGVLNGENVILVVQMFGSLSYSASDDSALIGSVEIQEVKSEDLEVKPPPPPPPSPQREMQVEQGESEDGRIKSIRIIYPEEDATYVEPQIPVKGEVENFNPGVIIEIISENSVIGETEVKGDSTWVFENLYDWKEGRNSIDAVIEENEQKYRDSVTFFITSTPPKILGVNVEKNDGEFNVVISVEELAVEISLVFGDKIIRSDVFDGTAEFTILEDDIKGRIFVVVSDIHGNIGQEDITSHFFEKDTRGKLSLGGFVNFNISSFQRFMTILLAVAVLGILNVQLYFYIKANKVKEKSGDFLMVGIWWLIFLFGSFIGYSGSIY